MLPLWIFILIYLSKSSAEGPAVNSSSLTEHLHQSLLKVNAFLEDVQHKIRSHRESLRSFDYDDQTKEQEFLDYTLTSFWWNGTPATGQITPKTSFLTTPENHRTVYQIPSRKYSFLPEITTTEFVLETDKTPSKYVPPGYTPSFSFETHPPGYDINTYDTRDPGPGDYREPPPPGGFPPTSPQYSVEALATLVRTTPTPSTTPDPRPPGPGYDLQPGDGVTPLGIESTPPSPVYPLTPELKPEEFFHSDAVQTTERDHPITFNYSGSESVTDDVTSIYRPTTTQSSDYPWYIEEFQSTTDDTSDQPTSIHSYPHFEFETTSPSIHNETTFSTIHPNISKHVENWFEKVVNQSGVIVNNSQIFPTPQAYYTPLTDRTTWDGVTEDIYPEYTTDRPPYVTPNISTTPESGDIEIKRQGEATPAELEGPTATGIQEEIILDNAFGLPYLGSSPTTLESIRTTIVEGRPANIPEGVNFDWATPTIAGDILHGEVQTKPDPRDQYLDDIYKEMDHLDAGYLSMFLLKITKLVATGKPEQLQPVLMHTELILAKLFDSARLAYLGQPLLRVTMNLGMALATPTFDQLQSYSSMVHFMLLNRKQTAAVDVNSVIDYADSLYTEKEGERLFMLMKEFEEFPNKTMPGKALCEAIIEAFLAPHRRLKGTERGQRLIDSINYALESRFPHLKDLRRTWHKSARRSNVQKPNQTTIKSTSTTNGRRSHFATSHRHRKRRHKTNRSSDISYRRSHKRSRVIRKLNEKRQTRPSEFNYETLMRRKLYNPNSVETKMEVQGSTTTAIFQKRFNIVTSAYSLIRAPRTYTKRWSPSFIQVITRRTTDYKLDLRTNAHFRPDFRARNEDSGKFQKAPEILKKPNDQVRRFRKRKKRKSTTVKPEESFFRLRTGNGKSKEARRKKLRRIVEVSSYSDEEEALKLNLISAMIHGNRTFHRNEINESIMRAFLEKREVDRVTRL